jgi:hypothetical protein
MGGHRQRCEQCGHEILLHNSCRNRHCPACQRARGMSWVNERIGELLPVGYFHAVFTIPDVLNPFLLRNKKAGYAILFRAVKETLIELAADPKRLGAQIGFLALLHTWGQNLHDHPHIHCLVPAGGIRAEKKKWKHCREQFLFPVAVMRSLFRGKFMSYFKEAVAAGEIGLHGALEQYRVPGAFQALLDGLYRREWVVYCKPPFGSPQAVIKYLGEYTTRIAISNRRIVDMDQDSVSFRYLVFSLISCIAVLNVSCCSGIIPSTLRVFRYSDVPEASQRIIF